MTSEQPFSKCLPRKSVFWAFYFWPEDQENVCHRFSNPVLLETFIKTDISNDAQAFIGKKLSLFYKWQNASKREILDFLTFNEFIGRKTWQNPGCFCPIKKTFVISLNAKVVIHRLGINDIIMKTLETFRKMCFFPTYFFRENVQNYVTISAELCFGGTKAVFPIARVDVVSASTETSQLGKYQIGKFETGRNWTSNFEILVKYSTAVSQILVCSKVQRKFDRSRQL